MRKLLSINCSDNAFNMGMLLMRIIFGVLMMHHGYDKLVHYNEILNPADPKDQFLNFMGLGVAASLSLCIFAEFFCSLFIILGLFTRPAAVALVINALVALILRHNSDFLGYGQTISLYLGAFLTLLIMGPGKISVDGMIAK
jgi:putative oxidoreductase